MLISRGSSGFSPLNSATTAAAPPRSSVSCAITPCASERPELRGDAGSHLAACHFPEVAREILEGGA